MDRMHPRIRLYNTEDTEVKPNPSILKAVDKARCKKPRLEEEEEDA